MKRIKVYLNAEGKDRKTVEAEILKIKDTTVWVKLPDGNIIKRKLTRDVVNAESKG